MMDFLSVRHTVSGSVEHSFKPGSGEELRGIEVNSARAVAAYQKALVDMDAFAATYKDDIARIDAETKRKTDEINAKYQAMLDDRSAKLDVERLQNERRRDLEKKARSFWGLSSAERRELAALPPERSVFDLYFNDFERHEHRWELRLLPHPTREFKFVREAIASKLGVASVAANTLYMTRWDVLEIYAIENGAWLEKTGSPD